MLKDREKILVELIALCKEQWETFRRMAEMEIGPKPLPFTGFTTSPNGVESAPISRARATRHFPNLTTNLRRDKEKELLSKDWLSKEKLVREIRKAFSLTNYPKYADKTDVLTGLVYGDLSLMKKSEALETNTGLNGTIEYRFIPGSKVNWTKK